MTSIQNIRRGHAEPEVERPFCLTTVGRLVQEGLPVAPRFEVLRRVGHGQNDSFFRVDGAAVVDPAESQRAVGRRGHTITGDGENAAAISSFLPQRSCFVEGFLCFGSPLVSGDAGGGCRGYAEQQC